MVVSVDDLFGETVVEVFWLAFRTLDTNLDVSVSDIQLKFDFFLVSSEFTRVDIVIPLGLFFKESKVSRVLT